MFNRSEQRMTKEHLLVARIGRTVGLNGDLKLHIFSDFPEQFKKGARVTSSRGELLISEYDNTRSTIRFEGYETPEAAKKLVNAEIYSSKEKSRRECSLEEGEYFWFDIEGLKVMEGDVSLGVVKEIQRLESVDYLFVKTSDELIFRGFSRTFLIPYIHRYIDAVDLEKGVIFTIGAMDILEAS